jgi:hypothetical protein
MSSGRRIKAAPRLACRTAYRVARGMQRNCSVASSVAVNSRKSRSYILQRERLSNFVPYRLRAPRIKEDHVLNVSIRSTGKVLGVALYARYVIAEVIASEDFVHHKFHIVPDLVINVEIDGPIG